MSRSSDDTRIRIATTAGLFVGGLAFFLVLLDFSTSLTRTAVGSGYASSFFDLQARALLDGRWAVPDGSLGIEGFLSNGATYTYFPPFPSFVRLPVLMTTDLFDGKLTVLSMGVAWVVLAAMITRLAWFLRRRVTERTEVTVRDAILIGIFLAVATGGTTLTYDAGQPWVYHEVYMWACAGAVGAAYWMLRVLDSPEPASIGWLAFFCVVCVGSRTTAGLAVCLVTVLLGVWVATGRPVPGHRGRWWLIVLAGALPWLAGVALNLHKFGSVLMFPLEDQVWTQVNEHRREALEVNGGTITGPQFFTTAFMAYFRLDGIRFVDYFPFLTLPAEPAQAYGGAFIDQSYRTGSVPAFMPLLLVLTALAAVVLLRPGADRIQRHLRPVLVGMVLITGGVMAYGYFAMRYVSDFVPALVVGGAIATAFLSRWAHERRALFAATAVVFTLGATWSLVAHVLVGSSMAAFVHEGRPLVRYVELQHAISPGQVPVSTSEDLPSGGSTDQLHVRGDCDALYLNTGDDYRPWVTVEERDLRLDLWVEGRHTGEARLATAAGDSGTELWVERRKASFRLVIKQHSGNSVGFWQEIPVDDRISVGIRNRTDLGFFEFSSSPGRTSVYSASYTYDEDWRFSPTTFAFTPDRGALRDLGITVTDSPGLDLALCEDVRSDLG